MIGTWIGLHDIPVDLRVPEALAGRGAVLHDLASTAIGWRAADEARKPRLLTTHEKRSPALDSSDPRRIEITVAGPAALPVARLHKFGERRGGRRQEDKDALDIYRLLQAMPTDVLAEGIRRLRADASSRQVTAEAMNYLQALFAEPDAPGCQMAARAVELIDDPAVVAASTAALAQDLLRFGG